jgi:hypothetical protein
MVCKHYIIILFTFVQIIIMAILIKMVRLFTLSSLLSPCLMWGQQAVLPAGGDTSSASGSVSYSVGQVFYAANSSSEGSVHEGVQHAFEWYPVSIKNTEHEPALKIFPNPSTGQVFIQHKIESAAPGTYHIRLVDAHGNMLDYYKLDAIQGQIDLNGHSPGWYTLLVYGKEGVLQTYKILKF